MVPSMKVKLMVTILLLFLVIVFMLQNAATVEIRLFVWEAVVPRSLLVFMMFSIGVVVGWFLRTMYRITRTASKH